MVGIRSFPFGFRPIFRFAVRFRECSFKMFSKKLVEVCPLKKKVRCIRILSSYKTVSFPQNINKKLSAKKNHVLFEHTLGCARKLVNG